MSAESKSGSQILQEVLNTAAASGLLSAERDEDDEDLKLFGFKKCLGVGAHT